VRLNKTTMVVGGIALSGIAIGLGYYFANYEAGPLTEAVELRIISMIPVFAPILLAIALAVLIVGLSIEDNPSAEEVSDEEEPADEVDEDSDGSFSERSDGAVAGSQDAPDGA
jgi:hypothetical protein